MILHEFSELESPKHEEKLQGMHEVSGHDLSRAEKVRRIEGF